MQFEDFFYEEIRLPSVNHFMLITDGFVTEISKVLFLNESDELINEDVRKENLINSTKKFRPPPGAGTARIARSINTKLMQFTIKPAEEGKYESYDYQKLEFTSLSDPSVEGTSHYGYVIFNNPRQSVKELFCSCNDFFFRTYDIFVKKGLATFDLDKDTMKILNTKFKDRQKVLTALGRAKKHNGMDSTAVNPGRVMFLCKHLYAAINEFMKYRKPVPMKITPPVPKKEVPINKIKDTGKQVGPSKVDLTKKPAPEVKPLTTQRKDELKQKTSDAVKTVGAIKQPTPVKSAVKPVEPKSAVKQPTPTKPVAKPMDDKSREDFRSRTADALRLRSKSFK